MKDYIVLEILIDVSDRRHCAYCSVKVGDYRKQRYIIHKSGKVVLECLDCHKKTGFTQKKIKIKGIVHRFFIPILDNGVGGLNEN